MPAPSQSTTHQPKKVRAKVAGRRRKPPVRLAPITARDIEVEIGTKSVDDPWEPGTFRTAPFNRRVDLLEDEFTHKRITLSQYEVGRQVQAVFERASGARLGSGGWGQGGSRDQTIAHELAIIYAVEDARIIRKMDERVTRTLGHIDARLLRRLLAERLSFQETAALQGKSGDRGVRYISARFRDALEALDNAFAARGLTVFDTEGERAIRAETGERTGEETDAQGRAVPHGHGEYWGAEQARYAPQAKSAVRRAVAGRGRVRDLVGARHRVTETADGSAET